MVTRSRHGAPPPATTPATGSTAVTRAHAIFHQSAGAVVLDGDQCLVVRRADRDEWVLPKGHLERGERPEAAAIREIREETGLEIAIAADLGPTRYRFGPALRHRKRVDWFLARRTGGQLRLEPIFGDGRFVGEEEALRLLTHANDRAIVTRAFAVLRAETDAR